MPYLCTQAFTKPTLSSPFKYYIKSPAEVLTIQFSGLSNTTCNFETTLTLADASPIDVSVFTYTSEVVTVDATINTLIAVTSEPSLRVSTDDISKEAIINLKLTINSKENASDTRSEVISFTVELIDNPCIGGFTNVPASSTLNTTYTAHTTFTPMTLTGVTNGSCVFSYELLNADLTPANAALFTVSGLTFTSDATASDPRIVNVTSDAVISITGTNANAGSYSLILRLNSDKNIHDNV